MISALIEAGDLPAAESACAAALTQCRDAGDMLNLAFLLMLMADLDVQAGRYQAAAAHLREALQIALRVGDFFDLTSGLVVLRVSVRRDRTLRRSGHGMGRPGCPCPATMAA